MLRVFLISSSDAGHNIEFFWPPLGLGSSYHGNSSSEITSTSASTEGGDSQKASKSSDSSSTGALKSSLMSFQEDCSVYGMPFCHFAYLFWPHSVFHNQVFELSMDHLKFFAYPCTLAASQTGFSIVVCIDTRAAYSDCSSFNECNVESASQAQGTAVTDHWFDLCTLDDRWRDLLRKYAGILESEQRRNGYLSKNLKDMAQIRRVFLTDKSTAATATAETLPTVPETTAVGSGSVATAEHGPSQSISASATSATPSKSTGSTKGTTARSKIGKWNEMMRVMSEQRNSIAADLRFMQETLQNECELKMLINGWIQLHVSFHWAHPVTALNHLSEHHTLLVLPQTQSDIRADCVALLKTLPKSGSQSLRILLRNVNPTMSFGDLSLLTNIDVPTVYRLALHLCHWNKAAIIDTISPESMFALNRRVTVNSLGSDAHCYALTFQHSLYKDLQLFNDCRVLSELLPDSHAEKSRLIAKIAWLLQRGYLVTEQTFLSLSPLFERQRKMISSTSNSSDELLFDRIAFFLSDSSKSATELTYLTRIKRKEIVRIARSFPERLLMWTTNSL